ncbi:hypothetical protein RFI_37292 [Reticulomyxa filosa]|uniref:Uncharacterized protein n=1 Tax=Reticulomyxa filosa TaxID=46433 RepID=X6LGA1_RETFI|nr:hypothetical protein RFI_37292 [Reticulomyxa filosa]|eukprot:ETO00167.1 hypothetical protein RFI_37292 [Reticulomyxa filosa]
MMDVHVEKSGDADNDKDSKKLSGIIPPWVTKKSSLRPEMEAAEGYREQLENQMTKIKEKKMEAFMARQEQQQVCDVIHIVKLQRSEQTIDEIITCDLKYKMMINELDNVKASRNKSNYSTPLTSMRNHNNNNHSMRIWQMIPLLTYIFTISLQQKYLLSFCKWNLSSCSKLICIRLQMDLFNNMDHLASAIISKTMCFVGEIEWNGDRGNRTTVNSL